MTSSEAAVLAGGEPSSVKRWADFGHVPTQRTPGEHRSTVRRDLVALLEAMESGGHGPGLAQSPPPPSLVAKLVAGDRAAVDIHLLDARARLGAWHGVADAVGDSLRELGELWALGALTIADEHVASETLLRSLSRIGDSLPSGGGPRCLLACVAEESHTLALALADLCARESGWTPVMLGARTPADEIVGRLDASREAVPKLVCLSASSASADATRLALTVRRVAAGCARAGATLLLGGTGAWPERLPAGVQPVKSFADFHQHLSRGAPPTWR